MKILTILALCSIQAAAGQTPSLPPTPTHTIRLVYDDSSLSDASRAAIIALLAKEPVSTQTSVKVTSEDAGITKLVQNRLHLSGKTDPISVKAASAAITALNNLDSTKLYVGQTLLIPNIPPHVYRENRLSKPAFRLSDAQHSPMTAASGPADFKESSTLPKIADPRVADGTAKELADPRRLADFAWTQVGKAVLPIGVHPIEDGGNAAVHLADGGKCSPESWPEDTPQLEKLKTSIATQVANPVELARIQQAAKDFPLVILDWNDEDKKHGQKVTSVVEYLLSSLGLQTLTIRVVDLNPSNNAEELQHLFDDYLQNYYCSIQGMDCGKADQKALISDVNVWLRSKPKSNSGVASVKQLLLEAVLWKFFAASHAVVNMSFSIDSLALEILQTQFLSASHSLGVSAASDDPGPEGTVGIPQRAAGVYPNFMNVTYGNPNGEVLGGYTNDQFNVIVTTFAQGCGYKYQDIAATDAGTSFASPYVATALWLRAILSGGDVSNARRDLVQSSFVSGFESSPQVESAGAFDLSIFLLPASPHILDTSGKIIDITAGTLRLITERDTSGTTQHDYVLADHPNIAFVTRGADVYARVRKLRKTGSPIPVADTKEHRLISAVLDYTSSDGKIVHYELADITKNIKDIKF